MPVTVVEQPDTSKPNIGDLNDDSNHNTPSKIEDKTNKGPQVWADGARVVEGHPINPIKVVVTDDRDPNPQVEVTGLPQGLTYNKDSKQIEGTPAKITNWDQTEEEKDYPATITAQDQSGNITSKNIIVTVLRDKDGDGIPDTIDNDDDNDGVEDKDDKNPKVPDSAKPKVNQPTEGDDKITGTGKPGAEIIVKDKDGKEIGKTTVDKDGNWEVKVPKDKPLKKDDKIVVEQKEEGENPNTVETTVKGKDDNGSGNSNGDYTYPDFGGNGSEDNNTANEDDNKKVKTDAEKNPAITPEKTGVKDKNHLTDDEKQEVIDKVKKANPAAIDVIVDDMGNATLIYADGSKNFIDADDLIYQVEAKKEMRSNTKGKKAGANVKTGVGSVSGLIGLAGISIAGLLTSKKKEEDE